MKTLDIVAVILLIIGGINLGLIGFFGFDLIGMIFGRAEVAVRIVYALIGIAAIFFIFQMKYVRRYMKK